jgi:hypothetical protein
VRWRWQRGAGAASTSSRRPPRREGGAGRARQWRSRTASRWGAALALVKAPLVVGRLRRRRRLLLHQKRVRDQEEEEEGVGNGKATMTAAASAGGTGAAEAELAWLEEMYRVGHWGFGRVSFSGEKENPVRS